MLTVIMMVMLMIVTIALTVVMVMLVIVTMALTVVMVMLVIVTVALFIVMVVMVIVTMALFIMMVVLVIVTVALFIVMVVMVMLMLLLERLDSGIESILLLHSGEDVLAVELVPRSSNYCCGRIVLSDKLYRALNLLTLCNVGM